MKVGYKNSANIEYLANSRIWFLNNAKPVARERFLDRGGLKIVRLCQRLGGEAP